MSNIPTRNHYIPQFYLRNFSQDKENVYRLDKTNSEIQRLPIPVVGFQKNLYTYLTKSGKRKSLEQMFSQMEGLAANAIDKLRSRKQLTIQERSDLSMFLGSQMVRTPAYQKQMLSAHQELATKRLRISLKMTPPERIQQILKERGESVSIEKAKDLIDFGTNEDRSTVHFDYPPGYWIKNMLTLTLELYPIFEICNWEVRHSVTSFGFLTSDHPFMLIPGEKPHPFYGVGLLTPKAKKVIPLAADMCLVAHEPSENPIIVHTEADKDFFRKVNKWTVRNAEKYVFSPAMGKIEKIVKQDKSLLKTPKRYSVS